MNKLKDCVIYNRLQRKFTFNTTFNETMVPLNALSETYFDIAEKAFLYDEDETRLAEIVLKPGQTKLSKDTFVSISLKEMLIVQVLTNYTIENHTGKRLFIQQEDKTEVELPMRYAVSTSQDILLSEGGDKFDPQHAIQITIGATEPFVQIKDNFYRVENTNFVTRQKITLYPTYVLESRCYEDLKING